VTLKLNLKKNASVRVSQHIFEQSCPCKTVHYTVYNMDKIYLHLKPLQSPDSRKPGCLLSVTSHHEKVLTNPGKGLKLTPMPVNLQMADGGVGKAKIGIIRRIAIQIRVTTQKCLTYAT
jgi:hypothetical protein